MAKNCSMGQTNIRNTEIQSYNHPTINAINNYNHGQDHQYETNMMHTNTQDNNPFRVNINKSNLIAIKAAIKDLSVGDFTSLVEDIESQEDFS